MSAEGGGVGVHQAVAGARIGGAAAAIGAAVALEVRCHAACNQPTHRIARRRGGEYQPAAISGGQCRRPGIIDKILPRGQGDIVTRCRATDGGPAGQRNITCPIGARQQCMITHGLCTTKRNPAGAGLYRRRITPCIGPKIHRSGAITTANNHIGSRNGIEQR